MKIKIWFLFFVSLYLIFNINSVDAALSDGVVSHWSFDANFSDTFGVNDFSQGGSASINTTFYLGGTGSLRCGDDNYVQKDTPTIGMMASGKSTTLSFWANFWNVDSAGSQNLFEQRNSGGTDRYVSWLNSGGNLLNAYLDGASVNGPEVFNNRWYHYVIVADGSNYKYYLNGTQIGSTTAYTAVDTTYVMTMCKNPGNLNEDFYGHIDDVVIWNRTLSDAEITSISNNQLMYPFTTKNLISGSREWTLQTDFENGTTLINLTAASDELKLDTIITSLITDTSGTWSKPTVMDDYYGIKCKALADVTLEKVTLSPLSVCPRCLIINVTNNIELANVSAVNNVCTVNISLKTGQEFRVVENPSGSACNGTQNHAASYSYTNAHINCSIGTYNTGLPWSAGSWAESNAWVWAFDNVTTKVSTIYNTGLFEDVKNWTIETDHEFKNITIEFSSSIGGTVKFGNNSDNSSYTWTILSNGTNNINLGKQSLFFKFSFDKPSY